MHENYSTQLTSKCSEFIVVHTFFMNCGNYVRKTIIGKLLWVNKLRFLGSFKDGRKSVKKNPFGWLGIEMSIQLECGRLGN